jgi:hypothetical protein
VIYGIGLDSDLSDADMCAEALERCVSVFDVLELLGVDCPHGLGAEQQVRCSLHGADAHPSARVYPGTNKVHCFACGKTYGVVGLVMGYRRLGKPEAVRELMEELGLSVRDLLDSFEEISRADRRREVVEFYEREGAGMLKGSSLPFEEVQEFWRKFDGAVGDSGTGLKELAIWLRGTWLKGIRERVRGSGDG